MVGSLEEYKCEGEGKDRSSITQMRAFTFVSSVCTAIGIANAQVFFVGSIIDFQGKCADLTQSSPIDFVSITSSSCTGNPNQRWVFLDTNKPDVYRIQSELFASSIFSYPSADLISPASAILQSQQAMARLKTSTVWNVTKSINFPGQFNIFDAVQGYALTAWDTLPNWDNSPLTLEAFDKTEPRQAFTLH